MKRKLICSSLVLFMLAVVMAAIPARKAQAALEGNGKDFSFDISGLSDKMQAAAVFTAAEYKGEGYKRVPALIPK